VSIVAAGALSFPSYAADRDPAVRKAFQKSIGLARAQATSSTTSSRYAQAGRTK
jgi:hypothetical protein